jgi:ABC-type multidrug transport system permease subunit
MLTQKKFIPLKSRSEHTKPLFYTYQNDSFKLLLLAVVVVVVAAVVAAAAVTMFQLICSSVRSEKSRAKAFNFC